MKYTGNIYRPPFEARSLLLQVTVGCSHNKCAFCTMYRDVPFSVEPLSQIEADLKEASRYAPQITRVFLENGDPFVLSADKLCAIAERIHRYLPNVKTIAMYASILNIKTKTDAELLRLRELGINELNIGVESGLDTVLIRMNKGYSRDQAIYELKRLQAAGIDYGANIIFGAAGAEKLNENAQATASLLNETQPYLIFTGTIHAAPGCPLYEDLRSGSFKENTVRQYLAEEEIVLSGLTLKNCYYFGLHPSNIIPMQGYLPKDQQSLLRELQHRRETLTDAALDSIPRRGDEGRVLL